MSTDEQDSPEPFEPVVTLVEAPPSATTLSTPPPTPFVAATAEDSDTDFQSAYSASPRDSYGSFEQERGSSSSPEQSSTSDKLSEEILHKTRRERVSSTATATVNRRRAGADNASVLHSTAPKHI